MSGYNRRHGRIAGIVEGRDEKVARNAFVDLAPRALLTLGSRRGPSSASLFYGAVLFTW